MLVPVMYILFNSPCDQTYVYGYNTFTNSTNIALYMSMCDYYL
jgi:hypothetical protein